MTSLQKSEVLRDGRNLSLSNYPNLSHFRQSVIYWAHEATIWAGIDGDGTTGLKDSLLFMTHARGGKVDSSFQLKA